MPSEGAAESVGRRLRIGLLVESLSNRFWHEAVVAIEQAVRAAGCQLRVLVGGVLDAPTQEAQQENLCHRLPSPRSLDGLIVTPLGPLAGPERLSQLFLGYGALPTVCVNTLLPDLACYSTDNCQAMTQAVEHLIVAHGAKRLAFVCGPELNVEAELRLEGYRQALARHGLPQDPSLVVAGDFTRRGGRRAMRQLLERAAGGFDAVVAANDSLALGVLDELERLGVRVPGEVLVVGFDDVAEGRWSHPSLSTVRQSLDSIASTCVAHLLQMIDGTPAPPLTLVAGELVLRESCGCRRVETAVPEAGPPSEKGEKDLAVKLAAALADTRPGGVDFIVGTWRRSLAERLAWQVEEGSGQFLSAVEDLLQEASQSRRELGNWQQVVSRLRGALEPDARARQEVNLLRARVLVAEAAERQQALTRIRSESLVGASIAVGSEMLGSFSHESMFEVLSTRLSEMGIGACVVALYTGASATELEVALAYRQRRIRLPKQGLRFELEELFPSGLELMDVDAWVITPLFFEDRPMGLACLELGPSVGQIYEWLRQQIAIGLEGARLLRWVQTAAERRGLSDRMQLQRELDLAALVQRSVLPEKTLVRGLDVAAAMVAATEVGGDCYDIIPIEGGCWFSIGDVAGHGLGPGVVMMGLQSSIAALVKATPKACPAEILRVANTVMFDSVRSRLKRDEHATLTLLRYEETGRCRYAGAHEELLVFRARTGEVEVIDTPGAWLGILPDIGDATQLGEFWLEPGDVLLLYTDGVPEAMSASREQLGMDRLAVHFRKVCGQSAEEIVQHLLQVVHGWSEHQTDDITLVAIKQCEFRASLPPTER